MELESIPQTDPELRRQLDKMFWMNKELLRQINERDFQTSKLKEEFRELQHEDMEKDKKLDDIMSHRAEILKEEEQR